MEISPVENVPLERLQLDSQNSRAHPADNLEAIKASLQRFGQPEALTARRGTGVVIAGNGRLMAMRALGWGRADVRWLDCTDDEAKAYALVANRTSEMAKWDTEQLQATLDDLVGTDFDMDEFGFPDDFLDAIDDQQQARDMEESLGMESQPDRPKHGKPVQLTQEQREVFNRACVKLRENHGEDLSEGRCLELIAADYLAGA